MTIDKTTSEQKQQLSDWFLTLQTKICLMLENLEEECILNTHIPAGKCQKKVWKRDDLTQENKDSGGGTQATISGRVFEKGGVNVSTVFGEFSPEFAQEIPGARENPSFWASGLSLVIHPLNPYVPTVHMNTRHIITEKNWFGGGADLTPTLEFDKDTIDFHNAMKEACASLEDPTSYAKYKTWCDEYFYLPHRKEPRGIGGIFYDYHNTGCFDADFAFTQAVGLSFLSIYEQIVRRHMNTPWGEEEKTKQLVKRGRYAEFNLLYDRGTKFGLKTDGNVEAILMSLPPMASWTLAA